MRFRSRCCRRVPLGPLICPCSPCSLPRIRCAAARSDAAARHPPAARRPRRHRPRTAGRRSRSRSPRRRCPTGSRSTSSTSTRPGLVAYLLGRPHRQPQRGRAGQVGLRALLRAPDVPRQREVHDRELQRRHQGDGRGLERVHLRRPDRVPHPRRQGGAAQDRRDRGRPLPAPQVRGGQVPEGSARRAGRIQQERVEPDREDGRDAVRQRVHDAHVQAHDDGLPEGHRGHAQGVGVFAPVLRSLLPARKRHPPGRRRRRARDGVQAGREALRRVEARAASTRRCPSSRRRSRRSARR